VVDRQLVAFFCFAKRKQPKKRRPQSATSACVVGASAPYNHGVLLAGASRFTALLDWSGFLINSHDPLRGHVLKHIRQNSLTSLCYSVEEQGKKSEN
jgi:hypothetical protein